MWRARTQRLVANIRAHSWWIAPQAILVVVLSVTIGYWGPLTVYAVFNSIGVSGYVHRHGSRRPRRQMAFKLLAALLVPTGFLAFVLTGGGVSPSTKAAGGSDDPSIRKATAATSSRMGGNAR